MENKGWQVTFSDMLTLMLTFFVFLISISVFKTEDYQRFWESYGKEFAQKKGAGGKPAFELIKGINITYLPPDVEKMIDNFIELASETDFSGSQIYYDESRVSLIISDQLGFQPGSADLNPAVFELLKKFARQVKMVHYPLLVEGHTDDTLSRKIDNLDLSFQRAVAIAEQLKKFGVDLKRISVAGYGPNRPLDSNRSAEGRARNRRVEINLIIKKEA